MTFLERIIQFDKELFQFLNSLGNETWDTFWLTVTNQFSWIPLFLLLLILVVKAYGWKKSLLIIVIVALLVTFSDQFVNFVKEYYGRLRPNNDPGINGFARVLKRSGGFSFVSGHATTSFAVSLFLILTLKQHYKYMLLLFLWPILFAYSRIYVGVHYPADIFSGMLLGLFIGTIFYKISLILLKKLE